MNPWKDFAPATCMPHKCQCEAPRDQLIRQPSSFLSSIFVLLVPVFLWLKLRQRSFLFKCWLATVTFLALSSFFAHGSFTRFGISFDFGSIVVVISFFAYMRVMAGRSQLATASGLVLFMALAVTGMYLLEGKVKIAVCVAFVSVAIWDLQRERGWGFLRERAFHLPFAVLFVAFIVFQLDENHVLCDPVSWWQLHSLWHLGCGVGLYFYGKFRLAPESHPAT